MTQTTALLLTLAIEVPIVLAAARPPHRTQRDLLLLFAVAVGANVVTHPLLWLADAALADTLAYAPRVAALEVAVTLFEGIVYASIAGFRMRRGLTVSLVANLASTAAGFAIYALS